MARKSSLSLSLSLVISLIGVGIVASSGAFSNSSADLPSATAASENVSTGGSLNEKRIQERDKALASFKFVETGLPKWNGSETTCYNASSKTFTVDSPEDFAYALHYVATYPGSTINIIKDIDMGGKEFSYRGYWKNITFNGNNHTIYNYKSTGVTRVGICADFESSTAKNITFDNFYLYASTDQYAGVFPVVTPDLNSTIFDNVHVRNSLIYSGDTTAGKGRVGAIFGCCDKTGSHFQQYSPSMPYITNCSSENCFVYGNNHVGGTFGIHTSIQFKNCYSKNDTIVALSGHNGCFASCTDYYSTFDSCWASSTIYGSTSVGGLVGCTPANGGRYTNCFTSCVVEGESKIGGFSGEVGTFSTWSSALTPIPDREVVIENCYSTSMVGMNYNGSKLGGFTGEYSFGMLTNCYAAGEVGSVDTDTSDASALQGGLIGSWVYDTSKNSKGSFTNCYYDMQTTAMKNKAVGGQVPLTMTRDGVGVSTASWNGIKGLTTKKMTGKNNIMPSGYVYADGLYPQLAVMASHANTQYRAQSAASTATVFCDDWADLGNAATVFDTVRDAVRTYSFSSVNAFTSNPDFEPAHVISPDIASISWKTDGNVSSIDKTSPVVELSKSPYYSLSQSPGVEWVQVDLTYKNGTSTSTGNRRLRLIPTSTITAGSDKRIDTIYDGAGNNKTQIYNHNNDFSTTYCDATTLLSFLKDNVAHPNALVSFNYVSNITENGNTITGNLALAFNDKTKTLPISMELIPKPGTEDRPIEYLRWKLAGTYQFEAADRGFYELRYKISLPDGRYLSASKNLLITQQYVVSYLYNYTGLLDGSNITDTSIYAYKDAIADYNNFDYTSPYGGIAPVRDGYEFAYWSFDKEGMQPVSQVWFDTYEETYGKVRKSLALYAQWNRSGDDYTLTIDPKQGTYNGENVPTQIKGVAGNNVVITAATPAPDSREGFVDWEKTDDSAGTLTSGGSGQDRLWVYVFGEGDGYISAQYARNVFEVKWFDDVDGSLITAELVAAGTPAHAPHHPPKHIGRVFSGFDHMRWECVNEDMEVRLLYAPYIYEIPYDTDSLINQCIIKYPDKGRNINITFTIENGAFANGDTQRTYSTYCGKDDFVHLSWNGAEKIYGEEGVDESGYWAYNMVFADDNGLGVEDITSNAWCDRVKVWCLVEDPTYPIEWVDGHADAGEYKIYDDVEIFISFGRAT